VKRFSGLQWGAAIATDYPEWLRLRRAYREALDRLQQARERLDAAIGASTKGEFAMLTDAANRAFVMLTGAQTALADHLRDHQCGHRAIVNH
jgi:hypothetical protein